jgi:hypothetical protein
MVVAPNGLGLPSVGLLDAINTSPYTINPSAAMDQFGFIS